MTHEFGHALQHMLTTEDEGLVFGIGGIEWDAVELPSQFMENWCLQRDSLMSLGHRAFARYHLQVQTWSFMVVTFLSHLCRTLHLNCAVSIKKNTRRRRRYMYMNGDCFVSKTFLRDGFDENAGAIDHEVRGSLALPIINHEDQSCRVVLELVIVKEKPNLILSLIMFVTLFRKLDKLSPEDQRFPRRTNAATSGQLRKPCRGCCSKESPAPAAKKMEESSDDSSDESDSKDLNVLMQKFD
ncbi:hypothetical protein MKW98_006707 [Papaver atlanticum]|uniref:Peptidase M3A/M3B catalytic domain-containing protein n=1 Tax=Papaver atlanticum TaxID=357466 RepID=A0AAD4T2K1_9MAGN|nr:hypothetical protein MKW98_006707 [Papaver atlanticum]